MSTNITSVALNTPLADVAQIMSQQHLTSVVVLAQGKPIGLVSERDMTALCAQLFAAKQPPSLRELMCSKIYCVPSADPISVAEQLMRQQKSRHIIATDSNGLLCGVLSDSDLQRAKQHEIEQQYKLTTFKVQKLNQQLEAAQLRLDKAAREDALLKIGNRVAMDEALALASSGANPYSIAVIDIDHFKRFNDYYNHRHGDQALIRVSQVAKMALEGSAQLYRQSGNTLLALFADDEQLDTSARLRTVLRGIAQLSIVHTTAPLGKISASIGLASCYTQQSEPNHVVFRALNARDVAKSNGGNQLFEDPEHQLRAA